MLSGVVTAPGVVGVGTVQEEGVGDGQGRGVSPRLPRMGHQASPGMKMRKGSKPPGGAPEDPVKDLPPGSSRPP